MFDYVSAKSRSKRKSPARRLRLVVFVLEPSSTNEDRLLIASKRQYIADEGGNNGRDDSMTSGWISFAVAENSPSGTLVGTVPDSARCLSDRDITFTVRPVPDVEHETLFNFDPKTGSLSTTETLDGEQRREYNLAVFAQLPVGQLENGCDVSSPRSASSLAMVGRTKKGSGVSETDGREMDHRNAVLVTTLRVQVDDTNDNSPVIEFPMAGRNETVAPVPCDAQIGHVIARIVAHDPDIGDNARLVYRIQGQTEPEVNLFGVDFSTGLRSIVCSSNLYSVKCSIKLKSNPVHCSSISGPSLSISW